MERQLAGADVAADQQVVPRRGGPDPGPRVPAVPLGSLASGPDLPSAGVLQQRRDRLGAGHHGPAAQRDAEVRGDPQHVRLIAGLEVLAQLGAVAVHLVPAVEIARHAIRGRLRADVGGQLPLGAELQVQRQSHHQGPDRVGDVLAGDPLPRAGQRVPGLLPHVRQVHRVDPVRDPVRAPHVLPFDAGSAFAFLLLAGLVQRPDHQVPAPPPALARGLVQSGDGEPADCREGIPARPVQQPLRLVRRPVTHQPRHAPPVPLRQLAHHRAQVLARLQPQLHARETRPQAFQQLSTLPPGRPGAYPDGSSRLCVLFRHTNMITRRLPHA